MLVFILLKPTNYQNLVTSCLENNWNAQQELYGLFAGAMMGICYRFTKNTSDAEDVLQEGFLKVFTQLHTLQNVEMLAGWIKKIMIRECIDFLRRQKVIVFTNELPEQEFTQQEMVLGKLNFDYLLTHIRALPYGYQTVFNLYALDGFSHKEIAGFLGITEGASKSQYARAKAKLVQAIEQEYKTKKTHAIRY